MRMLAIVLTILMICGSQTAVAGDLEDFGNLLTYFYLEPSEEAFQRLQNSADKIYPELRKAGNGLENITAVSIARISQKHQWPIGDSPLGIKAQEIVTGESAFAKYVADDSKIDPTKLDMWWVSFFATGDDAYLEKIFKYAGVKPPKEPALQVVIVGAATWSFQSNCGQHKAVLEFAKKKLTSPNLPPEQTSYLQKCIQAAAEHEPR